MESISRKLISFLTALIILCSLSGCGAKAGEQYELYVLCQPSSFVYVRRYPKMKSEEIGWLELGDMVWTDGKKKNGFYHVYAGLETDGWIYGGFLTGEITISEQEMVVQKNNVACRRCIKGKIRKRLCLGDPVTVYAWSDDWAITDCGFIMKQYLEGD